MQLEAQECLKATPTPFGERWPQPGWILLKCNRWRQVRSHCKRDIEGVLFGGQLCMHLVAPGKHDLQHIECGLYKVRSACHKHTSCHRSLVVMLAVLVPLLTLSLAVLVAV